MRLPLLALLPVLVAWPALAQQGGYAGQQGREIKALSAEEQADLLAGRGAGLARAAELNSYPGPAHVLELRDRLGLTPAQEAATRASMERMSAAAREAGAELVRREREMDAAFRDRSIDPAGLASRMAGIGELQGRVRAIHLAAHLEMRELLTPQQVAAYDTLRGYGATMPAQPGQHRGHQPG